MSQNDHQTNQMNESTTEGKTQRPRVPSPPAAVNQSSEDSPCRSGRHHPG